MGLALWLCHSQGSKSRRKEGESSRFLNLSLQSQESRSQAWPNPKNDQKRGQKCCRLNRGIVKIPSNNPAGASSEEYPEFMGFSSSKNSPDTPWSGHPILNSLSWSLREWERGILGWRREEVYCAPRSCQRIPNPLLATKGSQIPSWSPKDPKSPLSCRRIPNPLLAEGKSWAGLSCARHVPTAVRQTSPDAQLGFIK